MGAVLDDAAAIEGDDAVGDTDGPERPTTPSTWPAGISRVMSVSTSRPFGW
jgi:hypothetical protein